MTERIRLVEVFTPEVPWSVQDLEPGEIAESVHTASGIVDGVHTLGRVTGQFFVPDGASRNGRFYPRSLWERVLKSEDTKHRLNDRLMFGTIGHDDQAVSEEQLRRGDVSHVITRLWIEDGKGLGEALILNTEAGRNLNTYLRAGCRLKTSSRASGQYRDGVTHDGLPVVDEDAYLFETFDFVLEPGFLEANPTLVESLKTPETEEKRVMSEEFTSTLAKQALSDISEGRKALQESLNAALAENAHLKRQLDEARERAASFEGREALVTACEKLGINPDDVTRLPRILEDLGLKDFGAFVRFVEAINPRDVEYIKSGRISERMHTLRLYETRVAKTPKEGLEIGQKISTLLEGYRRFGTPEQIEKKLREARETTRAYRRVGSPREAERALRESYRLIERYRKIGSPEQLERAMKTSIAVLEEFCTLGSVDKIRRALTRSLRVMERLNKWGGLPKMERFIRKTVNENRKRRARALTAVSEQLSGKYGVPVDRVREAVKKLGARGAESLLSEAKRSRPTGKPVREAKAAAREIRPFNLTESYYNHIGAKLRK